MAHRRTARTGGRQGVTLVELVICMAVMTLVLGAVLALQLQGLRMYQQVATTDWANFASASAVTILEEDIQGCFRVTGRYTDRITLSMPKMITASSGTEKVPARPLDHGDQVRYYLSDVTGSPIRTGSFLWRAVQADGSPTFIVTPRPLAEGITKLQFVYTMTAPPREKSVRKISVLVRAESREGGTVTERSHVGDILLRNVEFGPVTRESGLDPLEE